MKRSALANEVKRRLYNTDNITPWSEKAAMISKLCVKMLRSGYDSREILTFVQGGVTMFEKLKENSDKGECPLYRNKEHRANMRWRRKLGKKSNWSGSKSVLFVPTSNTIKEAAREGVAKSKENIKIVEKGGVSLKRILQRSDPCKSPDCSDPGSCDVCRVTEGGQKGCSKNNCKTNNVGYVGTCVTCQQMGLDRRYEGETARTLKDRSREHLRSINKKDESNGLYKHVKECHGDQLPTIRFQVRQVFDDAVTRQLDEGVRIEGVPEENLLNTKNEWVPPIVGRVRIE